MAELIFRRAALRDWNELFAGLPAKTQAQRYVFATGYSIALRYCVTSPKALRPARNLDLISGQFLLVAISPLFV